MLRKITLKKNNVLKSTLKMYACTCNCTSNCYCPCDGNDYTRLHAQNYVTPSGRLVTSLQTTRQVGK